VEGPGEGKCKEKTDNKGKGWGKTELKCRLEPEELMYMADCQDKI
jgi:hypothetical protein